MATSSNSALLAVVWCLLMANLMLPLAEGVWISLPKTGTKCISEEIQNHVVVLAYYTVVKEGGESPEAITVSAKVTSPYGTTLFHKENVTHGEFAFTTSEVGSYLACFWVDGHEGATLNLDWRMGVNAKDWDSVAKKEKIEELLRLQPPLLFGAKGMGVELELRKLEDVVESIRENLVYLKRREEEMREVSEKTNSRVAWYSILSLGICIMATTAQIFYLKRYFRKKKLI